VGINDGGRGWRVAAHVGAHAVAELIMNAPPRAILPPGRTGLIGGLPMWQIMGHQAPGTAGAPPRLDAMPHLAHGVCAPSTTCFFQWQEGLQALPLLGAEVCGVGQAPA
jgi:hypothetical protein